MLKVNKLNKMSKRDNRAWHKNLFRGIDDLPVVAEPPDKTGLSALTIITKANEV